MIKKYALSSYIMPILILIGLVCFCPDSNSHAGDRNDAQTNGLDVIFVIDNSGSMKTNDPQFNTKAVVEQFSSDLTMGSRMGMVIFDTDARLAQPLTQKTRPGIIPEIMDSLEDVNYRGNFTNSPAGIERAIYELKSNGRQAAQKIIIFITDGYIDTGDHAQDMEKGRWLKEDLTLESKQADIRIFGIAFTEHADIQLIQTLALKTGGEYFRAYSAKDISPIFTKITHLLTQIDQSEHIEQATLQPEIQKNVSKMQEDAPPEKEASLSSLATIGDKSQSNGVLKRSFSNISKWLFSIFVLFSAMLYFFWYRNRLKARICATPQNALNEPAPDFNVPIPKARLIHSPGTGSIHLPDTSIDKSRVTIGRDSANDIALAEDTVSSLHASIEFKEGYFYLEDHRSTNGTKLNNKKIEKNKPVRLKSGDKIHFAACQFTFMMQDQNPVGETVVLASSSVPFMPYHILGSAEEKSQINDYKLFKECLNKHLSQVGKLGNQFESFVNQHFTDEVVDSLASMGNKLIRLTKTDLTEHSAILEKTPILYKVCTLPVEIENGKDWFIQRHGGFTEFLRKSFDCQFFVENNGHTLCLLTYGRTKDAWISLSIVPVESTLDTIEILSVEFLTSEEKKRLDLQFGHLGSVV